MILFTLIKLYLDMNKSIRLILIISCLIGKGTKETIIQYESNIINSTNLKNIDVFKIKTHSFKLSWEEIPRAKNEYIGLVGVQYILNNFILSNSYIGIGGYGALTGDRGGFFTAGLTPGLNISVRDNLTLDLGLFIGGGGGAGAFPGNGEMIRGHFYFGRKINQYVNWIGFSSSYISGIKTGNKYSIAITRSIPVFEHISFLQKSSVPIPSIKYRSYRIAVTPSIAFYGVPNKLVGRNSDPLKKRIPLSGSDLEKNIGEKLNFVFSLYGASGGNAVGYGKIMLGLGYPVFIYRNLNLHSYYQFGMSGGGNIDTGGGFIYRSSFRLTYPLTKSISLHGFYGIINAPNGSFNATFFGTGILMHKNILEPILDDKIKNKILVSLPSRFFSKFPFKWYVGNKIVIPKKSLKEINGKPYKNLLKSISLGIEIPMNKKINLLSVTYWAYSGDIGAYAEGCFGLNTNIIKIGDFFIGGQSEIGAAGGGGVNANNGIFHQHTINAGYPLNLNHRIKLRIGWQGSFHKESLSGIVGVVEYEFLGALITNKE